MNADNQDFKYKELTGEIIRIFYQVYNKLGYGFLVPLRSLCALR